MRARSRRLAQPRRFLPTAAIAVIAVRRNSTLSQFEATISALQAEGPRAENRLILRAVDAALKLKALCLSMLT